MTPQQFRRVRRLFDQALELPEDERGDFVAEACRDDAEVGAEVLRLLEARTEDPLLGRVGDALDEALEEALPDREGVGDRRIGPYRIRRQAGEGGMGVVFEAEQEEPVRRRVALKLIKQGMDTRRVLRRFESERQTLALMSHPAIASIYEAGATADGRPYFSMEFVDGEPITEHCDARRLPIRERLELFLQVCDGVRHAHQKGILHRDLKPSNVLVVRRNGQARPKIIDFGIAKATSRPPAGRALETEIGQRVGTPAYMSPEQLDPAGPEPDTRTDVYSLGVILYELLTGRRPLGVEGQSPESPDELRRSTENDVPLRPSSLMRARDPATAAAAAARRSEPRALARRLRGDLDWISMRALERDRNRRYGSVVELAADVERHLRHEPVAAGPPSSAYRVAKFVRRHRGPVAWAALLALAALIAIGGLVVGLARAREAERQARHEAETSRSVSEFLERLFESADPESERGADLTAREVLDQGMARIDDQLAGQPAVRARLKETMGRAYTSLGLYDSARSLLEDVVEEREEILGPDHLEVAAALMTLTWVYTRTGEYEKNEAAARRALDIRRRQLGPEAPEVAESLTALANLAWQRGDYPEASHLHRRALEIKERALGSEHRELAPLLNNVGILHLQAGELAEARTAFERGLAIFERELGPDHVHVASNLNNLALVDYELGDYAAAAELHERALAIRERSLGEEHPDTAESLNNLGTALRELGELDAARSAFERALGTRESVLGEGHPDTASTLFNLGSALRRSGRAAEAWRFVERALRSFEERLGPEHPTLAFPLAELAEIDWEEGKLVRAEERFRRAIALRERGLAPDHPLLAQVLVRYALLLESLGREDEARAVGERVAAIRDPEDVIPAP